MSASRQDEGQQEREKLKRELTGLVPPTFKKMPTDHPQCGNAICEVTEDIESCFEDCGVNSAPFHPERYRTLEYQQKTRSYWVYVPPCYEHGMPIPVIMNFHGGGGTGEAVEIQVGQMNASADRYCFIAVYPNGYSVIDTPGRRQHWNAGERVEFRNQGLDDVGFVSEMLDDIEATYTIDRRRIYATGISNGAMMCYRLACELSDRVAAIAPVGAGMVVSECKPSRPVSLIHFHGTMDPGWPYDGGKGCFTRDDFAPISATIARWREINQCGDPAHIVYQRGNATCEAYRCAHDAEVRLCTITGHGHAWPGPKAYSFPSEQIVKWDADCELGVGRGMGDISDDISAMDEMWRFFQDHPLSP